MDFLFHLTCSVNTAKTLQGKPDRKSQLGNDLKLLLAPHLKSELFLLSAKRTVDHYPCVINWCNAEDSSDSGISHRKKIQENSHFRPEVLIFFMAGIFFSSDFEAREKLYHRA